VEPRLLDESLDRELTVPRLAPLVLGDRAQDRPDSSDDASLLHIGKRRGRLDLEDRLDPRRRLLRVLASRPA
jgi:hypothetical protein